MIRIRLTKRSQNHLHSLYFGAFAVGADLAAGLHAFYFAQRDNISAVFKSFEAQFLKRPESDTYFVCTMGDEILDMIIASKASGERVNKLIEVKAYTDYLTEEPQEVARFTLELSIKMKT